MFVELKDTLSGFQELVEGKGDDLPEAAFRMRGTLDDVRQEAERMAKEG